MPVVSDEDDPDICPFTKDDAPLSRSHTRFAQDGYSLIKFLYTQMFKKHGWITTPVAGTGLGTYRHHGMYEHDDDMDMLVYPPLKYLLPPTLKERERWKTRPTRGGSALMEQTAYFRRVQAKYGNRTGPLPTPEPTPSPELAPMGRRKKFTLDYYEYVNVLKRDYSWPLSNLDTWRWVYDDFHEQFLEYQLSIPEVDFQWKLEETTYFSDKKFINLHKNSTFYEYHQNVGDDALRSCALRYDSTNKTELRRMFWPGRPCLPNHFHLCLQPTPFLYENAKHGPASVYTLHGHQGMGNLCKCRFGPKESDSHFMMCPTNMREFVSGWYGEKWCVAIGPVSTNPNEKSWGD